VLFTATAQELNRRVHYDRNDIFDEYSYSKWPITPGRPAAGPEDHRQLCAGRTLQQRTRRHQAAIARRRQLHSPDFATATISATSRKRSTRAPVGGFRTLVQAIREASCIPMATPFDEGSVDLCCELVSHPQNRQLGLQRLDSDRKNGEDEKADRRFYWRLFTQDIETWSRFSTIVTFLGH